MRVSKITGGARRFGRAVLELPGTWRGSLQLRVVSLTLLLSIVIAFVLGWVLNSKIRDGLVQAKEFTGAVGVTGIVLTKLDGTAKGGIALAIQTELGIPIKLVGLGEGVDDLAPFDPEAFVDALLD